jgi:hypothetical protein
MKIALSALAILVGSSFAASAQNTSPNPNQPGLQPSTDPQFQQQYQNPSSPTTRDNATTGQSPSMNSQTPNSGQMQQPPAGQRQGQPSR